MISPAPITRVLFLHGMFCPPEGYIKDLAPTLLQKLKDHNNCEVTFVESKRISKSALPAGIPFDDLMPSQVARKDKLPEWYNACDLDDNTGRKFLDGLDDALQQLQNFLNTNEAFDVIIGHSQGAQLAAILTLMCESEKEEWIPKSKHWKGIVCLNAPNPFDTEVTLRKRVKSHGIISTPSVHVYGGEKDWTQSGSKAMRSTHFGSSGEGGSKVWEISHDEGHFPPKNGEVCENISTAIDVMVGKPGS